jgi:tryptophan synthase alpha subunit
MRHHGSLRDKEATEGAWEAAKGAVIGSMIVCILDERSRGLGLIGAVGSRDCDCDGGALAGLARL